MRSPAVSPLGDQFWAGGRKRWETRAGGTGAHFPLRPAPIFPLRPGPIFPLRGGLDGLNFWTEDGVAYGCGSVESSVAGDLVVANLDAWGPGLAQVGGGKMHSGARAGGRWATAS